MVTKGRRYYVNYDDLTDDEMEDMIINFKQLYRKMRKNKKLTVYTSLPKDNSKKGKKGTKKLKLSRVKKSKKGWEPFNIDLAKIIFTTKNDDENLSRYDIDGNEYDGKYCIKLKVSPTYTPFYLVYMEVKAYNKRKNKSFKVRSRVYTVCREQIWGNLYRNETNPNFFQKIKYFFEDLFDSE